MGPSRVAVAGDQVDLARLSDDLPDDVEVVELAPDPDRTRPYDCVVVTQPADGDWDGLLARIREIAPDAPTLAITDEDGRAAASEAGVTDCYLSGREPAEALTRRIETLGELGRARRRAAAARSERERVENMFEAVMRHAPISIYFKDEEARHVRVSDHQMENLRGQRRPDGTVIEGREDVLGRTDPELYDEETAVDAYEDDLQVIETGEPVVTKEERWERTPIEWFATTKVPWRDQDGTVVGLVGFTIDIVDAKRSERLEEFVDVLTHDLRSPLNVAQGHVDLLRTDPEQADLDALENALERMSAFIDDLLSLAREGRSVGKLEPTETADLLEQAWREVEAPETTLEANWEARILADETRAIELLVNLFRNAIDHGDDPDTIRVGPLDDGFYVADDGPGIPSEEREEVLEWGYTTGGGTGFGLAIVRQIALGHGWSVTVTESEGGGARFEFRGVSLA